jgi:hypothetical protein
LLIDQQFFKDEEKAIRELRGKFMKNLETKIRYPDEYICRNYIRINLHVGLLIAFQRLLRLPVAYDVADERRNG